MIQQDVMAEAGGDVRCDGGNEEGNEREGERGEGKRRVEIERERERGELNKHALHCRPGGT